MAANPEHHVSLSDEARSVVELMAAITVPVSATKIADWLKCVDARTSASRTSASRAFSSRDVRLALADLAQRGLIISIANGREYIVPDAHRHHLLAAAHAASRLLPLVERIRSSEPLRPAAHSWRPDETAFLRELAWSLHLGLGADVRTAYERWTTDYHQGSRDEMLLRAWGSRPHVEGFGQVAIELVQTYLRTVVVIATDHFSRVPDEIITWARGHAELLGSPTCCELSVYLALRGEREAALDLLREGQDAITTGTRAFIAFVADDFGEARRLARQALERSRARSGKRMRGVEGGCGVWLFLLLLTDPDATSHAYAMVQLECEMRSRPQLVDCLAMFEALVSQVVDLPPRQTRITSAQDWLSVVLHALLGRFRRAQPTAAMTTELTKLAKRAEAAGFKWVASACSALTATSTARGLVSLYAVEAPWQRTLRALEFAVATASPAPDERAADERLAWVFTLAGDGTFELNARLQTRTATGWTGGRQVSWKRLTEAPPGAAYLTDHDRRLLQSIHIDHTARRYGSAAPFVLDHAAACELVGHPHVFVDGESREAVEVTRGTVRLEVREESDALSLTLVPESLLRWSIVCERAGPGRLVVYALDAAQRAVVGVFAGAPIRLPEHAREATQRTLAKLASRFSLISEQSIAAAQIEAVPADGRPRVRLRRLRGGVAVRVCVVPLEAAPACVPGHGSARLILPMPGESGALTVCAVRDLEAELRALHALYESCPTLRDAVGGEHEGKLEDLASCLELLCELRAAPEALVEWPEGEPLRLTPERDVRNVQLRLVTAADWLSAEGELEVDEWTRLSLHDLLERAAASRSRFIALDDGRYVALTDTLKKTLDGMTALASVKDARVQLHPLWLGIAGMGGDYGELACDAGAAQLLERVREASGLNPSLPQGFEAELRPYQHEGYAWLCRLAHMRAGACLADDMGLGKTLQALALLLAEAGHGPSLVVAPTSVCRNWIDEARRFAPALRLHELANGDRAETIRQLAAFDVLVCSYGLLQQELEALAAKHFRVLILDEAQAIKNAATQRARAAQQLVADIRVALTGTPVENHLGELWSIMHFLNPGLLGSVKAFEERFAKPIARDTDPRAARTLKRLIRPFVLRRRKGEVLEDLPPKTVITLKVQPSEAERALYAVLRERALSRIAVAGANTGSEARIQLLAEITRLRRAACHPSLVAPDTDIASSKIDAFETLLDELREGGHRALVFSQFIDFLALVRARLDALDVRYQYLDGSSSPAARSRAVNAFQAGEGEVFLISLKAGGFGINLTAADYVVHLDPWWNPAVEEQASDRAHRIGQTRPVTIYRLVMQNSIEEKILSLHANKRELADRLLEGTGVASPLNLEELVTLIRGEAE